MSTAALAPSRPVLRYPGGKFRLREWVIQHLPPHRIYVEPYGGAASVLLGKSRAPGGELYNDLSDDVVNLFRVLRDPAAAKDLQNLLCLTPFARAEFAAAYEPASDPVERARRLLVRSFMGHGTVGTTRQSRTGFRRDLDRGLVRGGCSANEWRTFPGSIQSFAARLAGVVIESQPALDLMLEHDARDVLHYVDPPYPHSARRHAKGYTNLCYQHEMSESDHADLLTVLLHLSGMVVLSGYPCDLYDANLSRYKWQRITRRAWASGGQKRTEVLWWNPAAVAASAQKGMPL